MEKIEKLEKDYKKTQHDITVAFADIITCSGEAKKLLLDRPGPLTAAEKKTASAWQRRLYSAIKKQEKLYARLCTQLGILESLKSAK